MAATWVDNLYCLGVSPRAAMDMIELLGHELRNCWGLLLKADSFVVMAPHGSPDPPPVRAGWRSVAAFPVLGAAIDSDAGSSADQAVVEATAWRILCMCLEIIRVGPPHFFTQRGCRSIGVPACEAKIFAISSALAANVFQVWTGSWCQESWQWRQWLAST